MPRYHSGYVSPMQNQCLIEVPNRLQITLLIKIQMVSTSYGDQFGDQSFFYFLLPVLSPFLKNKTYYKNYIFVLFTENVVSK